MPEGDSLHRAAARLRPLVGERVEASSPNPRGLVTNVAQAIDGRVLEAVDALGKNLLLRFEGDVVVRSHLRMNGRWRVSPVGARPWQGRPWLVLRTPRWEATQWNGPVLQLDARAARRLGPDLLADATRMRGSRRTPPCGRSVSAARRRPRRPARRCRDREHVARGAPLARAPLALARAGPGDRRRARPMRCSGAATACAPRWPARGPSAPSTAVRSARCPRCGGIVRSRGLGDQNRTAYWCERCQRSR